MTPPTAAAAAVAAIYLHVCCCCGCRCLHFRSVSFAFRCAPFRTTPHIHSFIHSFIHIHTFIHSFIHIHTFIHIHSFIFLFLLSSVLSGQLASLCICLCICLCVCLFVCVFIFPRSLSLSLFIFNLAPVPQRLSTAEERGQLNSNAAVGASQKVALRWTRLG